ncbi:hypothetical protein [Achromobacter aloeverae]
MIRAAAIVPLALLAGCSAGIAHYTVRPFYDAGAGQVICCEWDLVNGKNVQAVTARITKTGSDYTIELTEQGVDGSTGQAIAAKTASDVAGAVSNAAGAAATILK